MLRLALVVGISVAPLSARAQTDQVRRGPPPAWAQPSDLLAVPADAAGAVFNRRHNVQVRLEREGQASYVAYRTRILNPSALQLGTVSITWQPAAGAPTVHAVTVHRGAESIDALTTAKFEVLRREDGLDQARLDGNLTAVLRVPDLRVGDELEVAVTLPTSDPTLGKAASGLVMLASDPPPGRYQLGVSWDDTRQPVVRPTPDLANMVVQNGRSITLRLDNPPVATAPDRAPPRYAWRRAIEFSEFADWGSVSRRFAPLYAAAAAVSEGSPVAKEAARIAAAHSTTSERIRAALKLVQQDVRYTYVGLDGGNLRPATAAETWARRYGDCKGKTALLLAILARLKIPAEPVLVLAGTSDDGLDQRLPGPALFDHVLVRARVDGGTWWLDGTLPPVATPSTTPLLPLRWVLPLSASGATLEDLGWSPPQMPDEVHLFDADAGDGFDALARVTTTDIVRGPKGLREYVGFSALSPAQLTQAFRQKLVGDFWQTVDQVQWRYDEKTRASVLRIVGTATLPWEKADEGGRSWSLPGGGFSPPDRRVRAADQDQTAPYRNDTDSTCYVTTVRLPKGMSAKQWAAAPSYDQLMFGRRYYRAFDLRDDAIRMVRASRPEVLDVDAATAKRDNARLAAFDNSMGWINYTLNPSGWQKPLVSAKRVPTTDEIDWTADSAPCGPRVG